MEFDFWNSLFAAVALEEEALLDISHPSAALIAFAKEIMRPRSVISS